MSFPFTDSYLVPTRPRCVQSPDPASKRPSPYALPTIPTRLHVLPMSSSSSSPKSSHPTPRHRILTVNIHICTLQLIAALLLTLMLLWHISTITLVENYKMPAWWVKCFLAKHANGWRVGVWTVVGVFVSPIEQTRETRR